MDDEMRPLRRKLTASSTLCWGAIAIALAQVNAQEPVAHPTGKKSIQLYLATSKESKATTTFSSDVMRIYAVWKGQSLEAGDKIKAVWIAEDIGEAAPKESKILEGELKVYKPDEDGAFYVSRPSGKIWPVGKYAVIIYINGNLAQRAKFTIRQGVQIEVQ